MIARIRLSDGRSLTVPVTEVVVTDEAGQPLAVTYAENGLVTHCDATKSDFGKVCRRLKLTAPDVEVLSP